MFQRKTCSNLLCFRGSLGFGEEALQSLPGKVGSQVQIAYSNNSFFLQIVYIEHFILKRLSFLILILFSTPDQDVNDVLAAVDHIIDMGLANPSKIAVMGLSHGGFLTTHLIGQVSVPVQHFSLKLLNCYTKLIQNIQILII